MSVASVVWLLVYLIVIGLVLGLVWWAGNALITLLPPPFQQVARVVLIVFIALVCIGVLLGFVDGGLGIPRWGPPLVR